MRIVIIGVGAMGSLFAGRISPLTEVVMLGNWPEQLATLNKQGLQMIHPDGRESRIKVKATNEINKAGKAELALVLVKGWQTERAAKQAKEIVGDSGLALTLQNGLGNLEILAGTVGKNQASLGVTSEGATMIGPGVVRHAGKGVTHLATTPETAGRLKEIAEIFNRAGFKTHLVGSATSLVWGKLAVNAGINPLTALLQVLNGYLYEDPVARALMCQAAEEAAAVAKALGIDLPYESASDRTIEVAKATAANRSSMAQDIARGMPTEIDTISGAISHYGQITDVLTPLNDVLIRLVKAQIETGDWRHELVNLPDNFRERFRDLAQVEIEA
jgi:2-dehydropantoate 2-reductase